MAAAATAANTLSAMASGRMAACTWPWMTSGRVTGKYRPDTFWCVTRYCSFCSEAASVAR